MKKNNILLELKKTKSFFLKNKISAPEIAIISGSGLSDIKLNIKSQKTFLYKDIPYFKQPTAQGHVGELVIGKMNNKNVWLFNGRLHYYEGYNMQDIVYPIRFIKYFGVKILIITCAVGAINKKYNVGDVIVIKDHINFMFDNPLIGRNEILFGERFPDLTDIYNSNLRKIAVKTAKKNKIKVHEGIYIATSGPSYETAAEISAFSKLGADVVGMSLVPEAITAKHMNMKILALAYISNKASGLSKTKLSHKEVLELGKKNSLSISKIILQVIKEIK